jgi:protein-L-isoaspartate O-methyltransferase
MPKKQKKQQPRLQICKTSVIDTLTVFIIRFVSNVFWIIVDIFSYDNTKIAKRYEQSVGQEYKREYATLNLSKEKKILHIGCGSYPLTELSLAELFDVHITGIDKNKKAVLRAKKIIKQKNLENSIRIEMGNGTKYPMNDFDLIIVSSCALPKKEILDHIFSQAKKNCKIIIRDFDIYTDAFVCWIEEYNDVKLEKKIYHHVPSFLPIGWNTFHLHKK